MTPTELRATLQRLGWSQAAAAKMLGLPYRTMQDAVGGLHKKGVPPLLAIVLHLADTIPAVRAAVERRRGG